MDLKKEDFLDYIAIKPTYLNCYLWFDVENVQLEYSVFTGLAGWGKEGSLTNIKIPFYQIESVIHSKGLFYS